MNFIASLQSPDAPHNLCLLFYSRTLEILCVCSRAVHPTWECVSVTENLQGPPYFIKDDFVSHLVTSRRIKMCTALTHTLFLHMHLLAQTRRACTHMHTHTHIYTCSLSHYVTVYPCSPLWLYNATPWTRRPPPGIST